MTGKIPSEILIATKNAGKVDELRQLMAGLPVTLRYLPELGDIEDVEETGTTFEQNANLKASAFALRTGMWAIADDSGLEVDALDGEPGVYSARYGGHCLSFDGKMALVIERIPDGASRAARFVSVIALSDESGNILFTAEGVCDGTIAEKPAGSGGFGYDPIFVPHGFTHTFAELPAAVKQQISHRARASAILIRYLLHFNDV